MDERIITDFWKEKLIFFQRQSERCCKSLSNAEEFVEEIEKLKFCHPELKIELENSSSSVSVQIFMSSDFCIRLFYQRMTKISFMGRNRTVFEKIADAKLFYSPFESLSHFIQHFSAYQVELYHAEEKALKSNKLNNFCLQFVKAYIDKKNNKGVLLSAEIRDGKIILVKNQYDKEEFINITPENFKSEIDSVLK